MPEGLAYGHSPDVLAWAEAWQCENFSHFSQPVICRAMPWSCVSQFITDHGKFYLKEMAAPFACEPAIIHYLALYDQALVPRILGINPTLHSFIMSDAGEVLRPKLLIDYDEQTVCPLLTRYAGLQLAVADHAENLLEAGAQDWRLSRLPGYYASLLANDEALLADGLTKGELQQLTALKPQVEELCTQLATFGLPETIEHGDFHDNNVLVNSSGLVINDWGDAAWAHPFFSLARFLRSATRVHATLLDYPKIERLRQAYFSPWLIYGDRPSLSTAYLVAAKLSHCVIAHSLTRIWTCPGMEATAELVNGAIAGALRDFMNAVAHQQAAN